MSANNNNGLLLRGLDGSNPLGFLAAVGTLRTVHIAEPEERWSMSWETHDSAWTPSIRCSRILSEEDFVEVLCRTLSSTPRPEFGFAKNLDIERCAFREKAMSARRDASRQNHRFADFMAAFGSEIFEGSSKPKHIQDTEFRTMSGAGHQDFLGTMEKLAKNTTKDKLHESLFQKWDYSERKFGMRWDPNEDRRYALRWKNPSDGGGVETEHGANRLAIEALPLFPAIPGKKKLETSGFAQIDRSACFTWPIWNTSIGMEVVRSLLAIPDLQMDEVDRSHLCRIGVSEVFRSDRLSVGRYRNFTRAVPA